MAREGDIFITKLESNFFGAIRILKRDVQIGFLNGQYAYLVQISNYIEKEHPRLNDSRLLQPLLQTRFHHKNTPCIAYFGGSLKHDNLIYLDNIPLTTAENDMVYRMEHDPRLEFDYRGVFNERTGWEALMEWRWRNEKLELLNEEIVNRQNSVQQLQEREKQTEVTMSEDTFWKFFLLLDWSHPDPQGIIEPAIRHLYGKSVYEIRNFAEILSEKLYYLDTKQHAENMGKNAYSDASKIFSVEDFLGRRCLIVARGKILYQEILEDPTKMPLSNEFIALLDIVPQAYYRKVGKPFTYQTKYSFDTFANREAWDIVSPEDMSEDKN